MEFEGKRVLVTGGTRGVGRSIVEEFLKAGARVAVNGASEASVDDALAQIGGAGSAVAAPGDLGTVEGCRHTVEATLDALGGIDTLVNNAGINRDSPLLEMGEEDWDQVLNVNLKGPMLLTQLAGKAMLGGAGGQIINISAVTGVRARANAVNYCCSKAGLLMLTKCAALELGPKVRVNAIALGFVHSRLAEEIYSDEQLADIVAETPVRRMAEPREVADLVLFLASEKSAFVTGQTIIQDGGRIMR
jgi:NAD(P)-dependent dehydrogenase (short-subunit alcohol dehydrogenase family)